MILLIFAGLSFVTAAILLFTGPRMRFQTSLQAFERTMPYPPDKTVDFYHSPFDTASFTIPAPSKENIDRGWIYYNYYCAFCHGINGKGNGEVGKSYIPKPADLSVDSTIDYNTAELYSASFHGTGHSPVLERVIPYGHRAYILLYIRYGFK